jgi:hypothetical protein
MFCFFSDSEQCWYRTFDLINKYMALVEVAFYSVVLEARLTGHPGYIEYKLAPVGCLKFQEVSPPTLTTIHYSYTELI